MRRSVRWQTMLVLAAGALLGYLAASGDAEHLPERPRRSRPSGGAEPVEPTESGTEATLAAAQDPAKKPNILVIFGDDIGQTNVSAYSMGLMGYRTPNIDRIAREGMIFTDYYAEQSCTAGRSSFITGQCTFRTGPEQGRGAGVARSACRRKTRRSPSCSSRTATPPASSARTTSATERIPAHGPRLRRVLRQPLPPQRRGGARAADLPARPASSRRCSAPAAC